MTFKRRRIIFWALLLVFPAIAMPIIFWSFGYRFSFEKGGITRTGGLFLSSIPATNAQVYINNKLIKETSFLSRSAFVQGLTPGSYAVRIFSDGFYEWTKELEVKPEFISEAKALLIKTYPGGEIVEQGDFLSIEPATETMLLLKTEEGENRYFDIYKKSFLSSAEAKILEKTLVHEDQKGFIVDEEKKRILRWQEREIWVEWQPETLLPFYAEENPAMILKTESPVRNAVFYPRREAVIAAYANGVFVAELDGRGGHNIFPLYKGVEPNFALPNSTERTIYILDDGNLIEIPLL